MTTRDRIMTIFFESGLMLFPLLRPVCSDAGLDAPSLHRFALVATIANTDYSIRIPVLPRLYRPSQNFQNDAIADLSPGRFTVFQRNLRMIRWPICEWQAR